MPPETGAPLSEVLADLCRHPVRQVVRKWNYKAALTSASVRGVLFFVVNAPFRLPAATAALLTEMTFRLVTSGFYGALTQSFRRVTPARVGMVSAIVVLPLTGHVLEFAVHWWQVTASLALSLGLSLAFTVLSTAFNLFAMRRGVLVVGECDSRSLLADLRALPSVFCAFVRSLLVAGSRADRRLESRDARI